MSKSTTNSTVGQRLAVALVAIGLGSVVFGLAGFKKHQRDADEIGRLSRQYAAGSAGSILSPASVHPAERMARWNLLIWTGVGFSYFGVSMGVAMMMHQRVRLAKLNRETAAE